MTQTTKPRPKRKLTDREYLDASLFWPKWPMLPLIKRDHGNSDADCGFLFSHSREPEPIVYLGNVFLIGEIADEIKAKTGNEVATWGQILDTMERVEFPSLEAVLEVYRID